MRRITPVLTLVLALSLGAATASKPAAPKAKASTTAVCPIMKQKVVKAKATAVKTKSGKTVWVCCKSCIEPAKKLK